MQRGKENYEGKEIVILGKNLTIFFNFFKTFLSDYNILYSNIVLVWLHVHAEYASPISLNSDTVLAKRIKILI